MSEGALRVAAEQLLAGEFVDEPVRGRHRQLRVAGEVGQVIAATAVELGEDGCQLRRHRPALVCRVAGRATPVVLDARAGP